MFGGIQNTERMIGTMSVPELVKLAQNPTSGDPTVQYAAISEIEKRKKMQAPPQGPVSQPTVIEKMGMEAMQPPQQGPVPGDPRAAGVAALVAQGSPPPQRMAGGGPIMNRLQPTMDQLSPYFDTTARTPEEIQALMQQFYGDGSYLDELIPGMKEDEERARTSRNSDLWLALAQAGFGMASTGSIGEGALMGLEQARGALGNYNERMDNVQGRRERVGLARGQRGDMMAGQGLEALLASENQAADAQQDLVTTSAGIAEAGAQIEAMNARDRSQLEQIADALYAENAGEVRWERYDAPGTPEGFGLRQVEYTRENATMDALMMMSGTRGGRGPDDLNERLRAALFAADPQNNRDPASREEAMAIINGILHGEIGNAGSTTRGGDSASGATAPAEGGYDPAAQAAYRARRQQERGLSVAGQRQGMDIYDPYGGE